MNVKLKKYAFLLLAAMLFSLCIVVCSCSETQDTDAMGETSASVTEDTQKDPVQDTRDISVRSIYEVIGGVEHSRADGTADSGASVIELDYRSVEKMVSKDTGSSKTYYPRIKVLADGRYMLIYQDGRWGPNVYYKLSEDYVTWSEPQLLFAKCEINGDMKKFCTADAVVMPDGGIIAVCTFISQDHYTAKNNYNGMALKRSSDNAKSWSDMEIIYGATAWEPDILLRSDGELQIYFTHTAPYIELYGYQDIRSSGAAILRSYDGGKTWMPDTSASPYEAWRVLQIPVGDYNGQPFFNGQMPVAIELHNGNMMVAVETQYLDRACYISVGYSRDNWRDPLGITEAGPADIKEKMFGGVGPYLCQFDSGEVVLSYVTVQDGLMQLRVGSSDGHSFSEANSILDGISTGLWSSVEVLDDHTLGIACDYQPTLSSGETMSFLTVARGVLNHSFDAERGQSITVDGDNSDWRCGVEALFVGSASRAQSVIRVSEDDGRVCFLIDRLDEYLSGKDTVQLFVSGDGAEFFRIQLSHNGIEKAERFSGGKYTDIGREGIECATFVGGSVGDDTDKDSGCVIELALSKSMLGIVSDCISVNVIMNNTDKNETVRDELSPVKISDPGTWIKIGVN